jgi:hypothetical protein
MQRISILLLGVITTQAFDIRHKQVKPQIGFESSAQSHLHSVSVAVGTPPKQTQLLLDLNSATTHLFMANSVSYLTKVHKFYDKAKSDSASFLDHTHDFASDSCGFSL